jgi:flagellar basal-body rod protein FlgF/flagellar basal-body rod protein FlgG
MNSGYYAACTGLIARTEALDTIANNLANVSTAGFRASHNVFSSLLVAHGDPDLSVLNQDANDYGVLSGTRLDTSQGSLVPTGNELDLAVQGPGYFAVQTADGTLYTRGGSFRVSPLSKLITAAGDPVLGDGGQPITIVGGSVSISPDGTISSNGAISGRLRLVEFAPTTQLKSAGGSYYIAPANSATPATQSQVSQAMLESSNVNPVMSGVELINAQREVETMRHVLTMINGELDKTAVQDLPRIS